MSENLDVKGLIDKLTKMKEEVTSEAGKAMGNICLKVQETAMKGMTNTTVDNSRSYGKRRHHPSVPGAYPAVDYGTLRRSITFEVKEGKDYVIGTVGSTVQGYPAYLEHRTSKMEARPWLKPSVESTMDYLKERSKEAVKKAVKGD